MIRFKWGLVSGAAALVISLSLGIVSDVLPFYVFLRSLIFSVVFFGLGIGLSILIGSFLPELLAKDEEPIVDEEQPGSRVNITLGNAGEYAVPEMYTNQKGSQELGNIEELISGGFKRRARNESFSANAGSEGIDRKGEDVYNSNGNAFKQNDFEFMEVPSYSSSPRKSAFTPMFGDDSAGLGGLLDLDSIAGAFSSGGEISSFKPSGGSESPPPAGAESFQMQSFDDIGPMPSKSKKKGDNPAIQGDFSPQEIAQGIRTVLDRDK